jgi:hypothetical protein
VASPSFPVRKSMGAGGMTGGPGEILDGPPPSPASPQQPLQPGQQAQFPPMESLAAPVTAGTPGRQLSPQILMGIMEGMTAIEGMWDSMASMLPDMASDFALLKDLQQRTAAKITIKGGTASATSAGNNFPGGGFDRGAM